MLFSPRTVFRWHRELVKRKWTHRHQNKGGRPGLSQNIQNLTIRLARENPRWGYGKIEWELLKLGIKVSQTTIRNILNRNGIVPASVRASSIGWRHLMNHYKNKLLACDFLTVETLFLNNNLHFLFLSKLEQDASTLPALAIIRMVIGLRSKLEIPAGSCKSTIPTLFA